MIKLSDDHRDFMKLIARSEDSGDGWRQVSTRLRPLCERQAAEKPDLYETKDVDGTFFIRLTEKAVILLDYI